MTKRANRANLLAGVDFWLSKKKHWPGDFHNQVYWNLKRWRVIYRVIPEKLFVPSCFDNRP